jgi:hypothetical protein
MDKVELRKTSENGPKVALCKANGQVIFEQILNEEDLNDSRN